MTYAIRMKVGHERGGLHGTMMPVFFQNGGMAHEWVTYTFDTIAEAEVYAQNHELSNYEVEEYDIRPVET